jgi:hypothetical protein
LKAIGIIVVSLFSLLFFPGEDKDVIIWSEDRALTWDDFRGPPAKRWSAASTTYDILQTVEKKNDHTGEVTVEAVFFCNKSWKKVSWINNSVLVHEQKHFDIAELFARQLRQRLSSLTYKNFDDLKSKSDSLYKVIDKEMDIYQDKYDDETDASMNGDKQREWNKKITDDIALLNKYKSTKLDISFSGKSAD